MGRGGQSQAQQRLRPLSYSDVPAADLACPIPFHPYLLLMPYLDAAAERALEGKGGGEGPGAASGGGRRHRGGRAEIRGRRWWPASATSSAFFHYCWHIGGRRRLGSPRGLAAAPSACGTPFAPSGRARLAPSFRPCAACASGFGRIVISRSSLLPTISTRMGVPDRHPLAGSRERPAAGPHPCEAARGSAQLRSRVRTRSGSVNHRFTIYHVLLQLEADQAYLIQTIFNLE